MISRTDASKSRATRPRSRRVRPSNAPVLFRFPAAFVKRARSERMVRMGIGRMAVLVVMARAVVVVVVVVV